MKEKRMADRKNPESTRNTMEQDAPASRRDALKAALAATGAGVAAAALPGRAAEARGGVGHGPGAANTVEFRARFAQSGPSGESFVGYGYLIRIEGSADADLFSGAVRNDTTALFTAYAEGSLVQRVLDQSVHALDIEGTLTVYHRASAGASFADPGSFKVGVPVARYDLTLQDILTVFAPAKGIPTLTGAMEQTLAAPFGGTRAGRRLGRVGNSARLFATGLGSLVDPVTLNAQLEMAGNWVDG
jgi:hypothetical protein